MTAPMTPWGKDYRPGLSDDMKQLRGIGPFYWCVFRGRLTRRVQRAFEREIDPPYRWGEGLQAHAFGVVLSVGICRRKKFQHEYDAIAAALEAKDYEKNSDEIGDW